MSFGPNAVQKQAQQNQTGIANQAVSNAGTANTDATSAVGQGTNLLSTGGTNVNSGTNFLNTVLNGNQANTTALLQPNINQITQGNQQALTAASTLMPRGGGRSGSLFANTLNPQQQIQNLYNTSRTSAATALPQIGLQQQQMGTNLFNTGANFMNAANSALNTGLTGNQDVTSNALQQRQYASQQWSNLGNGIFNLATTPFGGSGLSALGRLGS